MTCDFVGHPVVAEALATPVEIVPFAGTKPLILVLPGSRKGEVTRLAPILGAVVAKIKLRHPLARVVLPTVPNVAELVTKLSRDWAVKPQIITDAAAKRGAFAAADMAIAASGTVSLELAANGCPMVIAYDMNRLTLAIMRQMALIDTVTLVNIVSGTRSVPEFIGPRCTPDLIADAVFDVLNHPQAQKAAMEETMQLLGRGGTPPHLRAAQSVLSAIDSDPRRT
jgi:lipid-A-disaccharide synthase